MVQTIVPIYSLYNTPNYKCGRLENIAAFRSENEGAHFATVDLYMPCDSGQVDRYLKVFERIYEESGHGGHFRMMMGEDYVALPFENADEVGKLANVP